MSERERERQRASAGESRRIIISVTSTYLINMCIEMVAWRVFRAIIELANSVTSSRDVIGCEHRDWSELRASSAVLTCVSLCQFLTSPQHVPSNFCEDMRAV